MFTNAELWFICAELCAHLRTTRNAFDVEPWSNNGDGAVRIADDNPILTRCFNGKLSMAVRHVTETTVVHCI